MNKLNLFINNKYTKLILIIIAFIYYILSANSTTISNYIMYSIYGTILYVLLLSKDTKVALFFVLLAPFTIYKTNVSNNIVEMFSWFVPIIFLSFGILTNHLLYKPKLKFGKFTIGLYIYFIGLSLSGIQSKTAYEYTEYLYKWYYYVLLFISLTIITYGIIYFVSTTKSSLLELSNDSIYLTILIILEVIFFCVFNNYSISNVINHKLINLGWAVNNEVAIIILSLMPLSIYKSFINIKKYWYYLIVYIIQFLLLILCVSKGAIISALICSIILLLGLIIFKKEYRKQLLIILSISLISILFIIILVMTQIDDFSHHLTFNTLNARFEIWKSALNIFSKNYIFGIGVFSPFAWHMGPGWTHYQFAHNTIIHSLVISGVFGTLCLIYHLVEKYSRVIYKINYNKFILLMCFIYPALYGLVDNTYLFINYYFILVYQMISFEQEIEYEEIGYLIHFNKVEYKSRD